MTTIKLVSSDLNGTLVHQHTMSDMIRLYVGRKKFQKANEIFKRQTSGTASIEEAFQTAGPLTKGLSLRNAIEYTLEHMDYVDGFQEFLDSLYEMGIPLVINSTGYSVTIYAIREQIGHERIHGHIGNILHFGLNADPNETLSEEELKQKVMDYFSNPESSGNPIYDQIKATGEIELGIVDEKAKAGLLFGYAERHFPEVEPEEIVHIGDTYGDFGGIFGVAESGGMGIAFNYNDALEGAIKKINTEKIKKRIYLVDKKSPSSSLENLIPIIKWSRKK